LQVPACSIRLKNVSSPRNKYSAVSIVVRSLSADKQPFTVDPKASFLPAWAEYRPALPKEAVKPRAIARIKAKQAVNKPKIAGFTFPKRLGAPKLLRGRRGGK